MQHQEAGRGAAMLPSCDQMAARRPARQWRATVWWDLGRLAVNGNDHVWISNFSNPTCGIVELAGCRPEANPPGMKMGDPISPPGGYVGGGMQAQVYID